MTIKEALKKIYKKLSGGKSSNSRSISGILNDISTVAGSGGGGSADTFIVNFTIDAESESMETTCDKTFSEIEDAIRSGETVVAHARFSDDPLYDCYYVLNLNQYGSPDVDQHGIGIVLFSGFTGFYYYLVINFTFDGAIGNITTKERRIPEHSIREPEKGI